VQDVTVVHRGLKATPAGDAHVVVEHFGLMNCLARCNECGEVFMMRRVYVGHERGRWILGGQHEEGVRIRSIVNLGVVAHG
jgi:uncharacterized Zn finger protein